MAKMTETEALVTFARRVLNEASWFDGGVEIQKHAEELGLIRPVRFDPAKHRDCDGCAEAGDPWWEFTGPLAGRAALASGEERDL